MELKQQERRKLVDAFCQKTGHKAMPDLFHIEVVPSLKILYCVTPKAASRQWRNMLYQFHITKRNSKLLLNSFPPSQQKQMLKTYFKFTPVCSWTVRAHSVSIQRQVCSYKKGASQNCCISRQRNPKELPSKRFKEFPWKARWHHFSWVHWVFSNQRKQ